MVDLFSVALSSGVSSAVSWGVKRFLDSLVDCRCGRSTRAEVVNIDYNKFHCSSCGRNLSEYINATDHTVNRNGTVAAAAVSNIHWPSWRDTFKLYYDLDTINSKYESVVVEIVLSEFRGYEFHRYDFIKKPTYEYCRWEDTWITIPRTRFPEERGIIAADLNVYNTWGDMLDTRRSLVEYNGR